jgi:hypothetical protein
MTTDKWYNLGYGVSAANTDVLNETYCIEFYNVFGKVPEPRYMSRPVLLNEIRKLQNFGRSSR